MKSRKRETTKFNMPFRAFVIRLSFVAYFTTTNQDIVHILQLQMPGDPCKMMAAVAKGNFTSIGNA